MKITGWHIDPTTQTITPVEVEQQDHRAIYPIIRADTFDIVRLPNREAVFVDDDGLLNGAANTYGMFIVKGDERRYPQPIAGHGFVLGHDADGESISATATLEQMQDWIEFATLDDVRERAQRGEFGR